MYSHRIRNALVQLSLTWSFPTGYGGVSPHPVAGYGLAQPDYAAAAAAAGYGGYQYQCGAYPPPPAYPPHAPPYSPPCYMPPPHAPHDKPKDSR